VIVALILKADRTREIRENMKFEEMKEIIGGHIETLRLPDGKLMLMNEDGNMLRLRPNNEATMIAGFKIVGDVIIAELEEI
jgi:hypothetical protein